MPHVITINVASHAERVRSAYLLRGLVALAQQLSRGLSPFNLQPVAEVSCLCCLRVTSSNRNDACLLLNQLFGVVCLNVGFLRTMSGLGSAPNHGFLWQKTPSPGHVVFLKLWLHPSPKFSQRHRYFLFTQYHMSLDGYRLTIRLNKACSGVGMPFAASEHAQKQEAEQRWLPSHCKHYSFGRSD